VGDGRIAAQALLQAEERRSTPEVAPLEQLEPAQSVHISTGVEAIDGVGH